MRIKRADIKHARELLERDAERSTATLRAVIAQVEQRLSPGEHYVGDAPAEITVLRMVVEKLQTMAPLHTGRASGDARMKPGAALPGIGEARSDVAKALSILLRGTVN